MFNVLVLICSLTNFVTIWA